MPNNNNNFSLGHGSFPQHGPVTFYPSEAAATAELWRGSPDGKLLLTSSSSDEDDESDNSFGDFPMEIHTDDDDDISDETIVEEENKSNTAALVLLNPVSLFDRSKSFFMRCSDLNTVSLSCKEEDTKQEENYHFASVTPPPGVPTSEHERWIALDNGHGAHAPVARSAVQALAKMGLETTMDSSMWTPENKTETLSTGDEGWEEVCSFAKREAIPASTLPVVGSSEEKDVLLWTGVFSHDVHGTSDLPAVRSLGIVNTSARKVFDLLVDSSRVKEYNKMSLGRTDLMVLQDDIMKRGPFGNSITKIIQSKSKPPLLRKVLRFVSLLHAQELDDGTGYLIVTRAVTRETDSGSANFSDILQSEIQLGVNVIRNVGTNRCILINVNHMRSPMLPTRMTKTLGLAAAANFIHDIRRVLLNNV